MSADKRNVAVAVFAGLAVLAVGVVNYRYGKELGRQEMLGKMLQQSETCDELVSKLMERIEK